MPQARTDLNSFATALALRLPGSWTSEYHRHPTYQDQFPTIERLWDAGHVDYIVSQYVLGHDAVLNGPAGEQLYVTDRPLYRHQFVVAALEPEGFKPHQISPVREPNGIAVPHDPVRAAAAVTRRVLPRFRAALDAVHHNRTLFGCNFQYKPHEFAFVLPSSYCPKERALLVQLAAQRLMLQGIGVNFRRAAPLPPPTAAAASKVLPAVSSAAKSTSRR
ncbi:hypothetical protein OHB14_51520 [Streptomyces sp. NBC_01613]|uniref:hypothetical protein n=1 Tax=Streptomyces sp. NBC_01613 TaxID=2975896 RepID=UPI00386F98D5